MSNYGPPGGQYPDQPSDPWQQNDPYGQQYPTSPYGQPDPWNAPPTPGPVTPPGPYGQPSSYEPSYQQEQPYQQQQPYQPGYATPTQPGYGDPYGAPPQPDPYGGPPQPVWGPPAAAPKKRGPGGIIALVAVLLVVLCGGGVAALYYIGKHNTNSNASGHQTPAPSQQPSVAPSTAADSPTPDNADPITSVKVGQCVVNKGTDKQADLQIVTCGKNTYKVLARFNGTLDSKKCSTVAGYSHYFTYETTPTSDDFLLCLKKQ
jgi:hypothetical protein